MDISMVSIGGRIKSARKAADLTQAQIREKIGLETGALSKIENGLRVPSAILFYNISKAVGRSMEELITGEVANEHILRLCLKEENLIEGFRVLDEQDQKELMALLSMKLEKYESYKGDPKSCNFEAEESDTIAG